MWRIIEVVFASIPRALVNQASGSPEYNVGEVTPVSVSRIIASLAPVSTDVFADIGSGVGNIVVQVALQTPVRMCLGVELRAEVMQAGKRLIEKSASLYVQLRKVWLIGADIKDKHAHVGIQKATLLYSFNTLFTPKSKHEFTRRLCRLPAVRRLVISAKPCSRHREGCVKEFCLLYRFVCEVEVGVTYTSTCVTFYMYERAL